MATVGAVSRATGSEFRQLEETARELGATTRFSATEAAEGLLFLSRAGFEAIESIAALPSTLDLAAAGGLGLGEAADYASNILSQFRLQAEQTERVVDALVVTSNSANTDVRQLAEAMKFAGPVAGALGHEVEETAAAIGVLGDAGIQGSMAGTNLRGILTHLLDPTEKARDAIEALGLSIYDLDPAANSATDIFERLSEAELTAADATAIFQTRNAAAALQLTANVEKVRELTEANREAAGTAREQARVMEDTLSGSFKNLASATEAFVLEGRGMADVLRDAVDVTTGVVRTLAGMGDSVEENRVLVQALASTVKAAVAGFLAWKALQLVRWLTGITRALWASIAALRGVQAAVAANPFGLIATAVVGLTAVVVGLSDAFADSGAAAKAHEDALRQTERTTDAVAEAQERYNLALERGERLEATRHLRDQARAIEDQIVALRQLQEETVLIGRGQTLPFSDEEGPVERTTQYAEEIRRLRLERPELGGPLPVIREVRKDPRADLSLGFGPAEITERVRVADLIERLLELQDRLTTQSDIVADVEHRREEQTRSLARAEELRAQQLASLAEAQQSVRDQLAAATADDARAETRRRRFLEDAAEIAERLGLDADATKAYVVQVRSEVDALEALERQQRDREAADQASAEAAREQEQARRAARETIEDTLQSLRDEHQVLTSTAGAHQTLALELEIRRMETLALAEADEEEAKAVREQVKEILRLAEANEELTEAERKRRDEQRRREREEERDRAFTEGSRTTAFDTLGSLREEVTRLERDPFNLRQLAQEDRFRQMLSGGFGGNTEQARAMFEEYHALLDRKREIEEIADLSKEIGDAFAGAFEDIVLGAKDAGDAIRELALDIAKLVFRQAVTQPLASMITTGVTGAAGVLFSADGNAFDRGHLVPFAQGGILEVPTVFPLAGGRTGVAGEAGPEAVMPLARDSQGRLGVAAADGGKTVHYHNWYITTGDADSFRRSRRQIENDLARVTRRT